MLKSGLLNKKQINELQKEIEANYIDNLKDYFKRKKQDIRMNVFNYDNPLAEKNINGVNVNVGQQLKQRLREVHAKDIINNSIKTSGSKQPFVQEVTGRPFAEEIIDPSING